MYPVITVGKIQFISFNIVLIIAIFVCFVFYIESDKYLLFAFNKVLHSLVYISVFSCINGHLLSAVILTLQNRLDFYYNLLHSGFVFYGGLIGAVIGLKLYCKIHKENLLKYTDVFFSILPLGQAIGRIGCFLNGCCYGKEYNGFLAMNYPVNEVTVSIFPTWFVESFFCLILFLYMQIICKSRSCGFYTATYLIGYSLIRFFVEFMRGDEIRGIWGKISTSQIISVFVFIGGCSVAVNKLYMHETTINDMLEERSKK